jgi:hypothetical protein
VGEPLAQRRDGCKIINRGDLVVAAPVPDASRIELPRQPLVDVDLDLVRRLQPHVHPPELGIDQIQLIVQALARPHLQTLGLPVGRDRERAAGLQSTHTSVTPSCSAIARARASFEVPERCVLAILDRPLRRRRKRHDMIPDPLRLGLEEPPGVLQQNPPPGQVTAERPIGEEAVEMPLEDHPVERVDHP